MEEEETDETEQPVPPNTVACPNCGQSYKNPQGLAGHRRLAHSTSAARVLDERTRALERQGRELTAKERAAQQREAEAARLAEAARKREAELARRERAVRESEETTSAEKVRREIAQFREGLPKHEEGEIVRFDGTDYRVGDGGLTHVYFPDGQKHEHEEGDLFRSGETVYWIRNGEAVRLSDGQIIETILEWEAEDAAESDEASEER
jgi:hypothetical protein